MNIANGTSTVNKTSWRQADQLGALLITLLLNIPQI